VINKTTTGGISIESRIKTGTDKKSCSEDVRMGNLSHAANGMRVKSRVKAGGLNSYNHNQTARGIRIKSRIKAGLCPGEGGSGGGTTPTGK
jgi:hypothetical protein